MSAPEFTPGQNIPIATLANLRDIGGYATNGGGRVRTGLVFRSAELSKLSDEDAASFGKLGVKTVFDLRSEAERAAGVDRPTGAREVVLDVMADASSSVAAQLVKFADNPAAMADALSGDKLTSLYEETYRGFVDVPSAKAAYAEMFTEIAGTENLPALFHCTAGKDRTGWGAASLLLFLGVAEDDVRRDYMSTNEQLLPTLQPTFDSVAATGGDPDLMRSVYSVDIRYLEAALGAATESFGSIDGYFSEGLGLGDDVLQALRDRLTE